MSEFNLETEKQLLKNKITCYPDFPKPGIIFRDIFSLLADPPSFEMASRLLENEIKVHCANVDVIVGLEARGFILAAPLSLSFRKPFVPIRKQRKLPGKVSHKEFSLEYGTDVFEVQTSSIKPGQNVVIVDDLLATGGTMEAAAELIASLGANVCLCLVLMELSDLKGKEKIKFPYSNILSF